jgi:cytochrome c oxidase assembly protein subunit 15
MAWVTAAGTFVLILAGGLVTNTGAGLAVPDWPTTFGQNMFLYPWSGMVGGIFYEHSHRLIGSVVGLLTVLLAGALWALEPRSWLRWLGMTAVAMVIVQGVLGGLRVVLVKDTLAIIHGALAQAFFGLVASLVLVTSREWQAPEPETPWASSPGLRALSLLTAGAIYVQLVLGALLTHVGWRIEVHLLMAGLVTILVLTMAGRIWGQEADRPKLLRPALILCGLLVLQVLLGGGAYVARFTSLELPQADVLVLALPVSHRLIGGLLWVTSLVLSLRLLRMAPPPGFAVRRKLASSPQADEAGRRLPA